LQGKYPRIFFTIELDQQGFLADTNTDVLIFFGSVYFTAKILAAADRLELLCSQWSIYLIA